MLNYWQAVLVPDQQAEKYLKEDGYQGEVYVVGHPGWERYRHLNRNELRTKLCQSLNITNGTLIILYVGSAVPGFWEADETTFKFLLAASKNTALNPHIIATAHPRDEEPDRYQKIAATADVTIILPTHTPTDQLLPVADVIIGMYSTTLIHAAILGIPTVSILLPQAGRRRMQDLSLTDFPLNQIGATIGVYEDNPQTLSQILYRLQSDQNYQAVLRIAQERFVASLPLGAAERAADVLLKLTILF